MLVKSPKILIIRSDKTELLKVAGFLSDFFKEFGITAKYYNRSLLCISEAVINSIEHGNKNDHRKRVTLKIVLENGEIIVEINDEGDGFNIEEVECPTDERNLMKESGRGIYIIKSLTDFCKYSEKGNSIQFKICVSG